METVISSDAINLLFKAVISLIGILITGFLIPWLKNKVGEQKYAQFQEYVELAVRTAEMLFAIEEYKEKKEYVLAYVSEKAKELGIDLSAKDIDIAIEGWVNIVKHKSEV